MKKFNTTIIAEIGLNHGGSFGKAKEMITSAFISGANIVKFQIFNPDKLWAYEPPIKDMSFTQTEWIELKQFAEFYDLQFLCTPFDLESAEALEIMGVEAYKISSGSITDLRLLRYVASTGKTIFLSTGLSDEKEIQQALDVIRENSSEVFPDVVLMHCVSEYPTRPERACLNRIRTLRLDHHVVGYSNHSSVEVALLAVTAYQVAYLEVHVKEAGDETCIDSDVSLTFAELKQLVEKIEFFNQICNFNETEFLEKTLLMKKKAMKYCVAAEIMDEGTILEPQMIELKRTQGGKGIPADEVDCLLGRTTTRFLYPNEPIGEEDVS